MPILQGLPSDEELQQITDVVVPKLIAAAQQAGVTGTAPYSGDPDSDAANSASAGSVQDQVPPEHQEAYMLAQQGDYAVAAAAYEKVLEADPNDTRAARERAKALLLARSANADVRVVRAAAADKPDDVDAQLAVADIDMIGGQIQDAFDRLLDFVAAGGGGSQGRHRAGAPASARILHDPRADRRASEARTSSPRHPHVLSVQRVLVAPSTLMH